MSQPTYFFAFAALLISLIYVNAENITMNNSTDEIAGSNDPIHSYSFLVVSDEKTLVKGPESTKNAMLTGTSGAWTKSIPEAKGIWDSFYVTDPWKDQTFLFVKEFFVPGIPTYSTLEMAADNTYRFTLNGVLIGESNEEKNFSIKQNYNLLSNTKNGRNVLEFNVTNLAMPGGSPQINPAGLQFKLEISFII